MLQLLILLLASLLLIWVLEGEGLFALGLWPAGFVWRIAGLLFVVTLLCAGGSVLLRIWIAGESFGINEGLSVRAMLRSAWDILRGVLTEELICRGALLYILIKRLGAAWGIFLSSVLFGALHWLNGGVFGNGPQMLIVFSLTFSMGLLLAYSYVKTGSIWAPIAIHLGWNLTEQLLLPGHPRYGSILVLAAPPPVVTIGYLAFYSMLFVPKIAAILANYFLLRGRETVVS